MNRLTANMWNALDDIAKGRDLDERFPRYTGRLAGVRRQAHYGGLSRTLQGLRDRGLIDHEFALTAKAWRLLQGKADEATE